MICKEKKDIVFINDCNAIVDENLLRSAICWYSSKPVCKFKHIYMHGNYPSVSIYDKKIHIHRLIKMYLIGTDIEKGFYVKIRGERVYLKDIGFKEELKQDDRIR